MRGQARAHGRQPAWINLEYLTAESFAERSHGLPSPVLAGPAAGLTKHFFYPGFTARTGGLLREDDLTQRQAGFDRDGWLHRHGISPRRRAAGEPVLLRAARPGAAARRTGHEASTPYPPAGDRGPHRDGRARRDRGQG